MKSLSDEMRLLTLHLGASDEKSRIAQRAAQVQVMFQEAIEHLYGAGAREVLSHVNAVYIMEDPHAVPKKSAGGKRPRLLLIYMDDGTFRSDIHNQQYFLLPWFQKTYGEALDGLRTFPSRSGMRLRHPYAELTRDDSTEPQAVAKRKLSAEEKQEAKRLCMTVQNADLRRSLYRAMVAIKSRKTK